MSMPSLDVLGVVLLLAGAVWYLGRGPWRRLRAGRRTAEAPSCGGCCGCDLRRRTSETANEKDDASCVPTTRVSR